MLSMNRMINTNGGQSQFNFSDCFAIRTVGILFNRYIKANDPHYVASGASSEPQLG